MNFFALFLASLLFGDNFHPVALLGLAKARFGETVTVDGPRVTPLRLLEDSRCPANAVCVWAGRVRIAVRVSRGKGFQERELVLGQPVQIADGALELAEVAPLRRTGKPIRGRDYRFGFRFSGGL